MNGRPEDPGIALAEACTLVKQRAFASAEAALREGTQRWPHLLDRYGHPAFRKELMRLLLGQRRWAEAEALAPADGEIGGDRWHEVLFARARDAMIRMAQRHWRRVAAADPGHPEACVALGRVSPAAMEAEIQETAFNALPADRKITFVQVGANDGVTNEPLTARIRSGQWRGLLVEPVPSAFERLVANYRSIDGLVFERCAIGSERGTATFYLPEDGNTRLGSLSAKHVRAHFEGRAVALHEIEVPVETLTALLERHDLGALSMTVGKSATMAAQNPATAL